MTGAAAFSGAGALPLGSAFAFAGGAALGAGDAFPLGAVFGAGFGAAFALAFAAGFGRALGFGAAFFGLFAFAGFVFLAIAYLGSRGVSGVWMYRATRQCAGSARKPSGPCESRDCSGSLTTASGADRSRRRRRRDDVSSPGLTGNPEECIT